MEIEELAKPVGDWCPHCKPGKGCEIYTGRPKECSAFMCHWLADASLPEEFRPDRVRVMLSGDEWGNRYVARCDPANPMAWRNEPIYGVLKQTARACWQTDMTVIVVAFKRTWLITPAADYDLGFVDPQSPIAVEKSVDGTAKFEVLPPLTPGEDFDLMAKLYRRPPKPD
ncbi:MAG: hypothetical protein ACI9LT_001133 [Pseudoalteromonas distincta]|jgi:hypothetical protein